MRSWLHWKSLNCKIWKKINANRTIIYFYFHFHFHFSFFISIFINIWGSFPFFYFRTWILIANPSTVSVVNISSKIQLTKPTKISGNFFYTDYRTSGKKNSIRKILEENSSNSTNIISSILSLWWIFGGFSFSWKRKIFHLKTESTENSVDSGIHRKGNKSLKRFPAV